MSLIIRELSAGEIASKSFSIYRKHWRIIMGAYLPLGLTAAVLSRVVQGLFSDLAMGALARVIGWFISWLVDWVATALVISVVSDICLGHVPELRRTYRRITPGFVGKLLVTKFIYLLALAIGIAMFVLPAIGVYVLAMFHMLVLVVEGEWGGGAIKRSQSLGKDYYWRNLWVMLLVGIVYIPFWVFSTVVGSMGSLWWYDEPNSLVYDLDLAGVISDVLRYVFYPVLVIRLVLLYYDMRVRREAYDNAALAEELTF